MVIVKNNLVKVKDKYENMSNIRKVKKRFVSSNIIIYHAYSTFNIVCVRSLPTVVIFI